MVTPFAYPASYEMSITESLGLPFDVSGYLGTGQSPASPTSSMVDMGTGDTVDLGDPTVVAKVITQIVDGSDLDAGHEYLLIVNFTASPSSNVWAVELRIIAAA